MGIDQARQRIVVVDDNERLAELLREFLTGKGYAVEVCTEGDRAFAVIQSARPDLVILDVLMAGTGGLGVLYLLSTDPQTSEIPVLLCTAVSPSELAPWQETLEQRGVPILQKPFELSHLAAQVEALLAGPSSAG